MFSLLTREVTIENNCGINEHIRTHIYVQVYVDCVYG